MKAFRLVFQSELFEDKSYLKNLHATHQNISARKAPCTPAASGASLARRPGRIDQLD